MSKYEGARNYEFNTLFRQLFKCGPCEVQLTENDLKGFLETFDFPNESDWLKQEEESYRDSLEDEKYERWRDDNA